MSRSMGGSVSRPAQVALALLWTLAILATVGCGNSKDAPPAAVAGSAAPQAAQQPSATKPAPQGGVMTEAEALRARSDLPPEQRALVVVDGTERWVDAEAVESVGYTLVDLRDTWTPYIFTEHHTPDGVLLPNRYRRVLLGLANDKLDNDGEPLDPGEKNYLELYGVFPSLSVLRERFMNSAAHPCYDQESASVLEAVETVSYVAPASLRRDEARLARFRREVAAEQKKRKLATMQEVAARVPDLAPKVALIEKRAKEKLAMAAVEKRLACEGFLTAKSKHVKGVYDDAMRLAVRRFQQKHMIYEANYLRRKTVDALAQPLLENDYQSLMRAIRERVVSAAGVIEDGTVTWQQKVPVRNLAEEYTQATLQQLGLTDAQTALAFFRRHPPEHFKTLRAAVKLPPLPDYYSSHMDLSIVVDRGDVWYDLPFDEEGNFRPHQRRRYPNLTLFVTHNDQKIALARWRTTIGGWRAEQAPDGYEYFRYKMSDVGPRVIRQIVSGPVWIAPTSTPTRSLVKGKTINGTFTRIVNYDELGPGYLSAYGLIAGYFVVPGQNGRPDWDNGVRAHGSSDYLSIYSSHGYSHGCHRLPNHIAIRLYSFILSHRNKTVAGDQPLGFSRQFLQNERVYDIRLPSRGYAYYLDPPLPVNVLEGDIKGAQKKPIIGYIPKPNTEYPGPPPPAPDSPEAKAGGV